MIKNSFKSCAITTPIDGSKDDEIHCFRPQQPCSEGRSLLEQETAKLNSQLRRAEAVITEDPFESDEDDDETNGNEVVIDSDIDSTGEDSDLEQDTGEESDSSDDE